MSPAGQSPTMGSSGIPPMPGSAPPPQTGLGPVLGSQANQTPQMGPTPQEQIQAYMQQVQQLHQQIDALAQDHPEASDELNQAKNMLTNSMAKVASAVSSPAGQSGPSTF